VIPQDQQGRDSAILSVFIRAHPWLNFFFDEPTKFISGLQDDGLKSGIF
jgi:hypothetical protein